MSAGDTKGEPNNIADCDLGDVKIEDLNVWGLTPPRVRPESKTGAVKRKVICQDLHTILFEFPLQLEFSDIDLTPTQKACPCVDCLVEHLE